MAALEDFSAGRCHMDRLNRAYIVLLSKVQGAEQIGEFRPISLSNSLYLIFAKVLANRLRGVLASLYSGTTDDEQYRTGGRDRCSMALRGHHRFYVEGGFH